MSTEILDGILAHYGVKGMKWGVRRRLNQNRQYKQAEKEIFKKHNVGKLTTGLRPSDYPRIVRAERERRQALKKIRKPSEVSVLDDTKKIRTAGGHGRTAHPEAVKARTINQVAKKSGVKALSNAELMELQRRLTLEQSVARLQYNDSSPPKKFVLTLLGKAGNQAATDVSNASTKKVGAIIAKKMVKG